MYQQSSQVTISAKNSTEKQKVPNRLFFKLQAQQDGRSYGPHPMHQMLPISESD